MQYQPLALTLMPSIFLSHSSADKPFVRRLADDLRRLDVTVWIDEAELRVGDSLIERIATAIQDTEFVGAIISENSVGSAWVQKELHLAMTKEIESRRVVVLPIVVGNCKLPAFLIDKLYADFRDTQDYDRSLTKLHRSIRRAESDFEYAVRSQIGDKKGWRAALSRTWRPLRRLLISTTFQLILFACAFLAGGSYVAAWVFNHFADVEMSFVGGEPTVPKPFFVPDMTPDAPDVAMESASSAVESHPISSTNEHDVPLAVDKIDSAGEAATELAPLTPATDPLPGGGIFDIPGPLDTPGPF